MSDGTSVSMETHIEFEKRMDDNIRTQNAAIEDIKSRLNDTHEMVASVSRLAASMEGMAKEQERQGSDIREIRASVESINVEHIEITLKEHTQILDDHESRIREQELKPQDSKDHEDRLRTLEGKAGKNWEKITGGIIAGIVAFLVGIACSHLFPFGG